MQIRDNLIFYPERGLFHVLDNKESCIASTGGYVTPLFVMALIGKLASMYSQLLQNKEWQKLSVRTTFDSYKELIHFIALSEHEAVRSAISVAHQEALYKLVRIYLQWLVDKEDELVRNNPSIWLEPAFYPAGLFAESEDFDPYNRYDLLPIGGFARSAFYFFIANTAKNIIKAAIQEDNLLQAAKDAVENCKAIFDDWDNVKLQNGMFRVLLNVYLDWRYKQTEAALAHQVALDKDDIWQYIYNEELHARNLFDKNMDTCRLYSLRSLLNLHNDLLQRMQKDHPYISLMGKVTRPTNLPEEGNIQALIRWLDEEAKDGRDYIADHNGNVESLCKDIHFKKKIGWYTIKANSLRTALRRKIKK